ncbi:hypothetical protein M5K25_026627 [Dendrobium thyrsiflorum]|uniref:Uncharacterized protein n=1 Tax=Dendrobium thyrsiflorum TaxID=117978 RepID=A0ABD0TXN9_DENTH
MTVESFNKFRFRPSGVPSPAPGVGGEDEVDWRSGRRGRLGHGSEQAEARIEGRRRLVGPEQEMKAAVGIGSPESDRRHEVYKCDGSPYWLTIILQIIDDLLKYSPLLLQLAMLVWVTGLLGEFLVKSFRLRTPPTVESSPALTHLQHFGEFVDDQVDQPHFLLHVQFVFQTHESFAPSFLSSCCLVLKFLYLSLSSEISNAFVLVLMSQQALLLLDHHLDHHPRGLLLPIARTGFDLLERKPWPPNFFPFPPGSFVSRFLNTKFRFHGPMFTTWS